MGNPLLIMTAPDMFVAQVKKYLGKKVKTKKKSKAKVKKKTKTKVKEPKIVLPPRESPFAVGDEAWIERSNDSYSKVKILKCIKPVPGLKQWQYETTITTVPEAELLPHSIFSMIATDAVKMKVAHFNQALNETFDGEAIILAVFRQGQKRPWAYYVIPEMEIIKKRNDWKYKVYSYMEDRSAILYNKPVKKMDLKLLPISSAPNEILTYLGLHVYNRVWMKDTNDTTV